MLNKTLFLAPLIALAITLPLSAQQHGGHAGHGTSPAQTASPSTKAYQAVNAKMHADMNIKFSGDADVDFVKGMIPHHIAAVEMAKVVLQYGKDPELKKLATEIVAAQDKEIRLMREWLKKRGH